MEVFKDVFDYSDYEISNKGRVKTKAREIRYTHSVTNKEHFRKSTERYIKIHDNNLTGYKFVQLYRDTKMHNCTIHRLVALTFLQLEEGKEYVNHIDGNKHNNTLENLEWCTNEYNHSHATRTGLKAKGVEISNSILNEQCVRAIRKMLIDGVSHSLISKYFSVSRPTITLINTGKIWNHVSL